MAEQHVREVEMVASMVEEVLMHLLVHRLDARFCETGGVFEFKGLAGGARLSIGGGVSWIRAPGGAEVYSRRRGFVIEDLERTRLVCNRVLSELMNVYRQLVISGL